MPPETSDSAASAWRASDPFELPRLREEIRLRKFLETVAAHLRDARDPEGALRFVVRAAREHFDAAAACIVGVASPGAEPQLLFGLPPEHLWDMTTFAAALAGQKPPMQPNLAFARMRRRERPWALLALRRSAGEFDRAERQAIVRVGQAVTDLLRELDQHRLREVRDRIDRKIMSELRPIDLSYQILDALRSLTAYDHSSTMLMYDPRRETLEVVAEQIAWKKSRSRRIGAILPVSDSVRELLHGGEVHGLTRIHGNWRGWNGSVSAEPLAALLEQDPREGGSGRAESDMLCAPLGAGERVLGLLKVSSQRCGAFGQYEADLLAAFLPQASIAVQNSQLAETLREKMLAAERKHAMADLARGVSHDLKNALGSVLPLVEQLRAEAASGTLDPTTCAQDLEQIERSLGVCRRIFTGMLSFGRGTSAAVGQGQMTHAIRATVDALEESFRRRSIELSLQIEDELPTVAGVQSDLERLMLNLLSNGRDAMGEGGRLTVIARTDQNRAGVDVVVEDTGCGIAPEHMSLVQDPFFTTKPDGTGLGLTICRSIIWELRGRMNIESTLGKGTRVSVQLPVRT